MVVTVDDLCLEHLHNFRYFDSLKLLKPEFKLIAFAISNYKHHESLLESTLFQNWFAAHRDWVEIGVHSYDHEYPPDGDRPDEEKWIKLALNNLRPYLPKQYGYRSPGWQTTNQTVPILKKLGFTYIAYASKINDLTSNRTVTTDILNSHLYDTKELIALTNKLKEAL